MVNEMKTFKEMSAIPNEKDFVGAIIALQKPAVVHKDPKWDSYVRWFFVGKVATARRFFYGWLSKVSEEFPQSGIRRRPSHLGLALNQLMRGRLLIHRINISYAELLKRDDCDSLDQCKRLTAAALASMFTVAMRCIPSLAYLDQVRQLMVVLEDEKEANDIFLSKEDCRLILKEDCRLPPPGDFDAPKVGDFVPPETLRWIEVLGNTPRPHGEQLYLHMP